MGLVSALPEHRSEKGKDVLLGKGSLPSANSKSTLLLKNAKNGSGSSAGMQKSFFEKSDGNGGDGTKTDFSTLVGLLKDIRYFKEDSSWGIFIVVDENEKIHIVRGVLENPRIGMDVIGFGNFVVDPKYGHQFDAKMLSESLPQEESWQNRDRIYRSLQSIPHITEKRFDKLWDAYGPDLREKLGEVAAVKKVLPKVSKAHVEEMVSEFLRRGRFDQLYLFITGLGGGQGIVRSIIRFWDERYETGTWDVQATVARYKENPYRLLEVKGLGFTIVDGMLMRSKKVDPLGSQRIRAALLYVLREKVMEKGDTTILLKDWTFRALGKDVLNVSSSEQKPYLIVLKKEMECLIKENRVYVKDIVDENGKVHTYVSDFQMYLNELHIAKRLLGFLQKEQNPVISPTALLLAAQENSLSFLQIQALRTALSGSIGVLTGGPGTGKTTCMKTVLQAAQREGKRVALCAPTGKAASRLKSVAGMHATTIHSLIGKRPGQKPKYDESNPYPADLFIVDEVSMVDTELMCGLVGAISSDAGLLLVGDIWQLPSVGPGQILSDIVFSRCFPVGHLKENFRQKKDPEAGEIGVMAQKISDGSSDILHRWAPGNKPKSFPGYHGYATNEGREAADPIVVLQEVTKIVREALKQGISPDDIQVLSPMKKNELGVVQLNHQLQPILNAEGSAGPKMKFGEARNGAEPWTWRLGDRVIMKKNDHKNKIYNGDIGKIVGLYPKLETVPDKVMQQFGITSANFIPFLLVRFPVLEENGSGLELDDREDSRQAVTVRDENGQGLLVQMDKEAAKDLEPAYALTIHKTQGSEYPYVILVLHTQHWIMCERPLLYTGMTRAQKGLVLLGASKAVWQAARNKGNQRLTLLQEFLKNGLDKK